MINTIRAAILIGFGFILENPDKRKTVLNAFDGAGRYASNYINSILPNVQKGGAVNVPDKQTAAEPEEFR